MYGRGKDVGKSENYSFRSDYMKVFDHTPAETDFNSAKTGIKNTDRMNFLSHGGSSRRCDYWGGGVSSVGKDYTFPYEPPGRSRKNNSILDTLRDQDQEDYRMNNNSSFCADDCQEANNNRGGQCCVPKPQPVHCSVTRPTKMSSPPPPPHKTRKQCGCPMRRMDRGQQNLNPCVFDQAKQHKCSRTITRVCKPPKKQCAPRSRSFPAEGGMCSRRCRSLSRSKERKSVHCQIRVATPPCPNSRSRKNKMCGVKTPPAMKCELKCKQRCAPKLCGKVKNVCIQFKSTVWTHQHIEELKCFLQNSNCHDAIKLMTAVNMIMAESNNRCGGARSKSNSSRRRYSCCTQNNDHSQVSSCDENNGFGGDQEYMSTGDDSCNRSLSPPFETDSSNNMDRSFGNSTHIDKSFMNSTKTDNHEEGARAMEFCKNYHNNQKGTDDISKKLGRNAQTSFSEILTDCKRFLDTSRMNMNQSGKHESTSNSKYVPISKSDVLPKRSSWREYIPDTKRPYMRSTSSADISRDNIFNKSFNGDMNTSCSEPISSSDDTLDNLLSNAPSFSSLESPSCHRFKADVFHSGDDIIDYKKTCQVLDLSTTSSSSMDCSREFSSNFKKKEKERKTRHVKEDKVMKSNSKKDIPLKIDHQKEENDWNINHLKEDNTLKSSPIKEDNTLKNSTLKEDNKLDILKKDKVLKNSHDKGDLLEEDANSNGVSNNEQDHWFENHLTSDDDVPSKLFDINSRTQVLLEKASKRIKDIQCNIKSISCQAKDAIDIQKEQQENKCSFKGYPEENNNVSQNLDDEISYNARGAGSSRKTRKCLFYEYDISKDQPPRRFESPATHKTNQDATNKKSKKKHFVRSRSPSHSKKSTPRSQVAQVSCQNKSASTTACKSILKGSNSKTNICKKTKVVCSSSSPPLKESSQFPRVWKKDTKTRDKESYVCEEYKTKNEDVDILRAEKAKLFTATQLKKCNETYKEDWEKGDTTLESCGYPASLDTTNTSDTKQPNEDFTDKVTNYRNNASTSKGKYKGKDLKDSTIGGTFIRTKRHENNKAPIYRCVSQTSLNTSNTSAPKQSSDESFCKDIHCKRTHNSKKCKCTGKELNESALNEPFLWTKRNEGNKLPNDRSNIVRSCPFLVKSYNSFSPIPSEKFIN